MADVADIRPVKFWTKYVPSEEGLREVDWCEYARRGEAKYTTTPDAVSRLRKAPGIWAALEPHYDAWKNGRQTVAGGTPLDAWAGLSVEQIEILKQNDTRSLEDLSSLTDALVSKIGLPGLINLRAGAARFLAGLSGAKVENALAEKDAQITALQAQMADLMALMGQPQEDAGGDAEEPVRRKPGRPRREDVAA